jgi:hypothetical protein
LYRFEFVGDFGRRSGQAGVLVALLEVLPASVEIVARIASNLNAAALPAAASVAFFAMR